MAIDDLPMPVVTFLNAIGVEWPYINEDSLHHFAGLTREFGQAVAQTHEDATQAVANIAHAYQGASTQTMSSGWAHLSAQHVQEVTDACSVLADALEAWAVYVVAQKGEALVQLVELAIGYATALAAAPETLGASLTAIPELEELGEALGNSLIQDLEQYVSERWSKPPRNPLWPRWRPCSRGWTGRTPPGVRTLSAPAACNSSWGWSNNTWACSASTPRRCDRTRRTSMPKRPGSSSDGGRARPAQRSDRPQRHLR